MDILKLIICLTLICCTVVLSQNSPEIQTTYGKVRGITTSLDTKTMTKFLGIPFAKPPVEKLRFLKPQKMDPWTNVLEANEYSPSCYQSNLGKLNILDIPFNQSEDCLYLNIFVPGSVAMAKNSPKAVMFWIYGGGYLNGNANAYPADFLAGSQDVIVVTFNYRVALFGFMATDDGTIPGNMALFDQHAALKWVQENIAAFGGNPSKVTIFGESAGADSVFNHYMSPASKNLFSRAIILSAATTRKVTKTEQYETLKKVVDSVCSALIHNTTQAMLSCLQKVPAWNIVLLSDRARFSSYNWLTYDGEIIAEDPDKLLEEGRFDSSKEVIVGFMADDGDLAYDIFRGDWQKLIQSGIDLNAAKGYISLGLGNYFLRKEMPNKVIMENLVYQNYFSCYENPLDVARGLIDMFTDYMFASKAFKIAHSVAQFGGHAYLYEFDHLSEYIRKEWMPNVKISSGHTKDLPYIFGMLKWISEKGKVITPQEYQLSSSVMKAVSEFAKSGKPSYLTNSNMVVEWKAFTQFGMDYLHFTKDMTRSSTQPVPEDLAKRISLWLHVLEGIQKMETCDPYMGQGMPPRPNQGMTIRSMTVFEILIVAVSFWKVFLIN